MDQKSNFDHFKGVERKVNSIDNSQNIFFYNSLVGKLFIKFNKNISKWELVINDEVYGNYLSPVAAADDVYCQATGCFEWDSIKIESFINKVPTDIYCWEVQKEIY